MYLNPLIGHADPLGYSRTVWILWIHICPDFILRIVVEAVLDEGFGRFCGIAFSPVVGKQTAIALKNAIG